MRWSGALLTLTTDFKFVPIAWKLLLRSLKLSKVSQLGYWYELLPASMTSAEFSKLQGWVWSQLPTLRTNLTIYLHDLKKQFITAARHLLHPTQLTKIQVSDSDLSKPHLTIKAAQNRNNKSQQLGLNVIKILKIKFMYI